MKIEIFDANNVFRRKLESFGSVSIERGILDACRPNHIYVWDGYNHNARRREIFPGYKIRPPVGNDVYAWLDLIRELIMYSSATQIEVPEWEADDVIGVLARKYIAEGHEVEIHSNDLDYFQIEGAILNGINNNTGAPRKYIPLYKTLVGDKSDRIDGIPGFGGGAFMKIEGWWDEVIESLLEKSGWDERIVLTKKCAAWVVENFELLHAYWQIVHLWPVPEDLIDTHTYPGLNQRDKAEALLRKYML